MYIYVCTYIYMNISFIEMVMLECMWVINLVVFSIQMVFKSKKLGKITYEISFLYRNIKEKWSKAKHRAYKSFKTKEMWMETLCINNSLKEFCYKWRERNDVTIEEASKSKNFFFFFYRWRHNGTFYANLVDRQNTIMQRLVNKESIALVERSGIGSSGQRRAVLH